jgi:DNA-3-methyladenine glycosylase II
MQHKLIITENDIFEGLAFLQKCDAHLSKVISSVGVIPLRRSEPGFASLCKIIVSQQLSVSSAEAIWGRLQTLMQPMNAEAILLQNEDTLRVCGLSRPKIKTLNALSQAILAGELNLDRLCECEAEKAKEELIKVSGIGPWTADIYLLFAVGHADIFPIGDLALQNAVMNALALPTRPNPKELEAIAVQWSPWRGVAARLFWAYYATCKHGKGISL